MRYTLFVKLPGQAYSLIESDDEVKLLRCAEWSAKQDPKATITVCDRVEDVMLFNREDGRGGRCRMSLRGMFD